MDKASSIVLSLNPSLKLPDRILAIYLEDNLSDLSNIPLSIFAFVFTESLPTVLASVKRSAYSSEIL